MPDAQTTLETRFPKGCIILLVHRDTMLGFTVKGYTDSETLVVWQFPLDNDDPTYEFDDVKADDILYGPVSMQQARQIRSAFDDLTESLELARLGAQNEYDLRVSRALGLPNG